MAIGNPNGIPFCWEPPVKTASDIESSPNLRISADGGVSEFSNGCLDGRVFSLVQASPVGVLPSLLVVPQSYKSGKLYAQLPNARVNHIPNNSMFGASGGVIPSGWTFSIGAASGVSLGYSASGQATAEDGTLVDYIDFTFSGTATASGFLNLRPNASPSTIASVSGQSWNASVYFQLISGSVASISPTYQLQETTSGGTFIDGSNITGLGSLTTSLPLRRYNVTRDLNTSGTVVTCRWGHSIVSGTTYNYTLRIASPQLENLSSPTSVIRTVSGAVYAPYSGEAVRTNLAFHSESWANGNNWGLFEATNATGAIAAPNGTITANALSPTAVSGTHFMTGNNSTTVSYTSGTIYTQSAFFKAGTGAAGQLVQLTFPSARFTQSGYANFDLSAGTVSVVSGSSGDANRDARIENYGNGWYRCSFTATCNSTNTGVSLITVLITASGSGRTPSFTGVTGDILYGWGAQLETGSSATPYIRTTTAPASFPVASIADFTVSRNTTATRVNSSGLIDSVASGVPRIDWLGQSCPALLVEASGQNLALQSEAWNVSPWVATSGSQGATVSGNVTTSPDGTTNADKLIEAAVSGTHFCLQSFTLTSGTTYTASFFVKASERTRGRFRMSGSAAYWDVDFNLTSATVTGGTNSFIQNYGNGWYRIGATFTANQASNSFIVSLFDASGNNSYMGDGTSGFFVWGAQLETGSIATTYIPTTTAAVSRAAETISASGALVSGLIGQTEGTLYAEVDVRSSSAGSFISIDVGSGTDFILISKLSNFTILVQLRRANGSVANIITSSAVSIGVHKIALSYTNGNYALYIDGVSAGTSTNSTDYPALTLTRCSLSNTSYGILNDRIRAAALYTTRLTDAQLAELTRL